LTFYNDDGLENTAVIIVPVPDRQNVRRRVHSIKHNIRQTDRHRVLMRDKNDPL